jgi:lipid A disaccharide synthetase
MSKIIIMVLKTTAMTISAKITIITTKVMVNLIIKYKYQNLANVYCMQSVVAEFSNFS